MNEFSLRSEMLLGEEKIALLRDSHITIFGLGGVGGTAYECLLRSSVGSFCLVDFDSVQKSNLNRQVLYSYADVGREKVIAAHNYGKRINPLCHIETIARKVDDAFFQEENISTDFIIDAVDDIKAKVAIIKYAIARNIPFAVSLGMANRLDPSQVTEKRLDKTEYDPLAKKLREECRKEGIDLKKVNCVFSTEKPIVKGPVPSSMMMVPSAAGLKLAYLAIKEIAKL